MSTATREEQQACIEHLKSYIESFNAADLEAMKVCLAEQVQVFVEGKLASTGRDAILPSYAKDFESGKQVLITREPEIVVGTTETNTVSISVHLLTIVKGEPSVSLDMVYTYDTQAMNQVRHDISNIVTKGETDSG